MAQSAVTNADIILVKRAKNAWMFFNSIKTKQESEISVKENVFRGEKNVANIV